MRTITLETAVAELLRDIHDADHKHGADVETIARAYSAICAGPEETIRVVAGDKTASEDYLDGRPVTADVAPKEITVGSTVWAVGPDGLTNGLTDRIGLGRVASFHVDTNSGRSQPEVFAYIEWNDGCQGSWPVAQLRTAN
jgi:hypothetical protein